MEPTYQFDWTNLAILLATLLGFLVSTIKDYLTRQKSNVADDVETKNKVSALDKELNRVRLDFDTRMKKMDDKIEEKNNILFKKLADVEQKIDSKFDKLSHQIFELVKSMSFNSKDTKD